MSTPTTQEKYEFFEAVLAIPGPKSRAHEWRTLRKQIPPKPVTEILPARLDFFIACDMFTDSPREDFVEHLASIGVHDFTLDWTDGRPFQFIAFDHQDAKTAYQQVKRYSFKGYKIKICAKVQHDKR